jgi:hypothetical protein
MTDFEGFKALHQMLSMNNVSKKHWSNSSSWGIAKSMHGVLLDVTKRGLLFGECEQMNMIPKKLEYFIDICIEYCMTWKNILPRVQG